MSTIVRSARLINFFQKAYNNQRPLINFPKQLSTVNIESSEETKRPKQIPIALETRGIPKHKLQMEAPAGIFRGESDRFNGITVDTGNEYDEKSDFGVKLQKSLDYWTENACRGVWFKVRTEHSHTIPELTKKGFDFHHAKPGYVMLYRWLPRNEPPNVPVYAHTLIGVGGLVVNSKNEILAVSDRYALIPNSWKMPGGYVEPGENLIDAAIREVREETGVDTVFDTLVGVRQSHGGGFGCSDLYFVIALKPTSTDLQACPREICKVGWLPLDEYLQHPNVHETNRQFVKMFLDYKEKGIKFNCVFGTHQILNRKYCLYCVEKNTPECQDVGPIQ